jgi:hypothetical protein
MYVDVGVEKVVGSIFNVTKCLNHAEEFHSINGQALFLIFYKTFRPPQKKVFLRSSLTRRSFGGFSATYMHMYSLQSLLHMSRSQVPNLKYI